MGANRYRKEASGKKTRRNLSVKRKKPGPKRRKILQNPTVSEAANEGNSKQEVTFPRREASPCCYGEESNQRFEEDEDSDREPTCKNTQNDVHEDCEYSKKRRTLDRTGEISGANVMTNLPSHVSTVSTDSSCASFLRQNNYTEEDLLKESESDHQPESEYRSNCSIISGKNDSCKSFLALDELTENYLYRDFSQDTSGIVLDEYTLRKPKSEKYMDSVHDNSNDCSRRKHRDQTGEMEENYRILSVINTKHDYARIVGNLNLPSIKEAMHCTDNVNSFTAMEEDSGDINSTAWGSPNNHSRRDGSCQEEIKEGTDRISSFIGGKPDYRKIISSPPNSPPIHSAIDTADNINSPNTARMHSEDDNLSDVNSIADETAAECQTRDDAENNLDSLAQEEQSSRKTIRKPKKKSCDFHREERSINKFSHVLKQLQDSFTDGTHGPFDCGIQHQRAIGRVHHGLRTKYTLQCDICNVKTVIWSELGDEDLLDVDRCGVLAMNVLGQGYTALHQFSANMHIHSLNYKQYQELADEIKKTYLDHSDEIIKQNGMEEHRIAEALGSVVNGIATCPVIVDGSWPVRSYNNVARSESGMAVIISVRTGKVLWVDTKNKYCLRCIRTKNELVNSHNCQVNMDKDQSILKAESTVICEGFEKSIEVHHLMYSDIVADGDSNTYKAICDANPYKGVVRVKKIECNVHLKRCRIKDIKQIIRTFKTGRSKELKALKDKIASNIGRICHAIDRAAIHWRKRDVTQEEKEIQLKNDVTNVIHYVFGDHANCASYFCNGENKPGECNLIPLMKKSGIYADIQHVLISWSDNTKDLLEGKTANQAETFNSILAKYLGGKRCNVQLTDVYGSPVAMAQIQHDRQSVSSLLHEKMKKRPPPQLLAIEEANRRKNMHNRKYKKIKKIIPLTSGETQNMRSSKYYGRKIEKLDMSKSAYDEALKAHENTLKQWQQDREQIEIKSRCNVDEQYRFEKNLLFSHYFGKICSMRSTTPTAKTVKSILYGSANPKKYIQQYEKRTKQQAKALIEHVQPCGVIIDEKLEFLAAKPDGLIGDDTILKIYTPWQVRDHSMSNATLQKLKMTSNFQKHSLYYEVQGTLAITKRKECLCIIATNVNATGISIRADSTFWEKMVPKLTNFYKQWMTPEIVDSRHKRSMPLRDSKRVADPLQHVQSEEGNNYSQNSMSRDDSERVTVSPQREESRKSDYSRRENVEDFMATMLSNTDKDILKNGQCLECTHMDVFGSILMEVSGRLWEYRSPALKDALHIIKPIPPFQKHIQILNREGQHWVCAYYDTESIVIYDSLHGFNEPSTDYYLPYLKRLFPEYDFQQFPITFPLVQQQDNFSDCGVYSIAFAITLIHGLDPSDIGYERKELRNHLLQMLKNRQLTHFPLSGGECNITIPNINECLETERHAMSVRRRNFHREC